MPATDWLHAVAFIPFAHAGQRAMGHYRRMLHGSTTTFCADPAALPAVIADARPSVPVRPAGDLAAARGTARTPAMADDPAARAAHARALRVGAPRGGARLRRPELAAVRARLGLDRLDQPFVSAAQSAARAARRTFTRSACRS